jgi:hypothetical protein
MQILSQLLENLRYACGTDFGYFEVYKMNIREKTLPNKRSTFPWALSRLCVTVHYQPSVTDSKATKNAFY